MTMRISFGSIFLIIPMLFFSSCGRQTEFKEGLAGVYFSNADFTGPKLFNVVDKLDQKWGKGNGFSTEWSVEWNGYLLAPISGNVTIYLETDKQTKIIVNTADTLENKNDGRKTISVNMIEGEKYPIEIYYVHVDGGEGFLKLMWNWNNQEQKIISKPNLVYSQENEALWDWVIEPDKDKIDKSQFQYANGKNIMIAYDPLYFYGWPANQGIWNWGDEILVGLMRGNYMYDVLHHSIDKNNQVALLARSLDGGETWNIEDPENFVTDPGKPVPLKVSIDYSHPDIAIRHIHDRFYYSYDRGKTWKGPFTFTGIDMGELTSRTDYNIVDKNSYLAFVSRIDNKVKANLPDRAFCVKTKDGGKTFQFVSWMTETDTVRSVMSSTVRIDENHLISALRRRYDPPQLNKPLPQQNWIDVYESLDNGNTWQFLSKVADTDNGTRNGNPPSLVLLKDGRLCVTYGCRKVPYGIRAKISIDNGKTWGKEIIIRDDAITKDVGYPRSVVRPDGKVVTTYYYTTKENVEQHIAATIWDPNILK
ncbi:MAG: PA14 domain-containing protein [Melioribacteraceae bacterium]|nr:PA14 domain-containing protein [Melioribacteraceae bacterium]